MTVTGLIGTAALEGRTVGADNTLLRVASVLCNDATLRSEDGRE